MIKSVLIFLFTLIFTSSADDTNLQIGFYDKTCPQAEKIVTQVVAQANLSNKTTASGLLRLHFHDCFLILNDKQGCDASLLLDVTPSGGVVAKKYPGNGKTLRTLEVIDKAKTSLESHCPGIVSCADILAFAARDAIVLSGLTSYSVPAGRRDGSTSLASDAHKNLPGANDSVETITGLFARKGLTQEEMVVLLGAHSIGFAHCGTINSRLYNSTGFPELNSEYTNYLKQNCPEPTTPLSLPRDFATGKSLPLDSISPFALDTMYYAGLTNGKGTLYTDQALVNNKDTSMIVSSMIKIPQQWSNMFRNAMIKMGKMNVLTGNQGEIRTKCRSVN